MAVRRCGFLHLRKKSMAVYRNLIFDLGGVLLNIDYQRTARAFKDIGATDFELFYSQAAANPLFERLETGHLTDAEFYNEMRLHCYPGTTDAQILAAWNAILLDFRPGSIALLRQLQTHYRVFLLSNTNHLHYAEFDSLLKAHTGETSLDGLFEKAYYSFRLGLRKPYEPIYRYVLEDAGLNAAETLFIDDSPVNIPAPQQLGIHTHLLKPGTLIESLELL